MLNLASLRYRNAAAPAGGPIERIDLTELSVVGHRQFQANAFLRPELVAWKTGGELFSAATGSGTDASPMIARFKAVSEAMERWAQMAVISKGDGARYGFDVDPSSNGMAAFPGWRARQARVAARMEASERFNLLSWWEGRLSAAECASPYPGVRAAVLCSDAPGITVILFRVYPDGQASYGHAAGETFAEACERAAAELERHRAAIRFTALVPAGLTRQLSPSAHPIEKRCLYFSTPEGHEFFLERLRTRVKRPLLAPRLVFDGQIRGPWSRFSHVWRVCYTPPSERFLSDDTNYFYW